MGYYWLCNNLAGLDLELIEKYVSRMRLCFTEAAAYLKYFDEIEDTETRGYILRSRANMALGPFKSQGGKIRLVRETLRIMQDEHYQEVEPNLPWERYLYMTHQQMASSIAHDKSKVMSPEDTASIMESVYIVYQQRIQEAEAQHERPTLRWAFPCCTIEYYCGLYDFGRLLAKIEKLLDAADPEDHSPEGVYGVVSLPAFYCQYLDSRQGGLCGRPVPEGAGLRGFLPRRGAGEPGPLPLAAELHLYRDRRRDVLRRVSGGDHAALRAGALPPLPDGGGGLPGCVCVDPGGGAGLF